MASDAIHTKEVASGHIMDGTLMWCGMHNVFCCVRDYCTYSEYPWVFCFIKFHLKHLYFFISKCEYSSVLFIKFKGHKE